MSGTKFGGLTVETMETMEIMEAFLPNLCT